MGRQRSDRSSMGPFRSDQIRPGDRYELAHGHPIYCLPTGGDGARGAASGAQVLDTDPEVNETGIDAGYSPEPGDLRAPNISVGNVPDRPGWIQGVPPLAVEYAGGHQGEGKLQEKIQDLLARGTRWVWVVRLIGPRRVEIYETDQPVRTVAGREPLLAPGLLRNPVPAEALYDRRAAHEVTLRNLLQRRGYESIDEIQQEAREEGREEGRAQALLTILLAKGFHVSDATRERILAERKSSILDMWLKNAVNAATLEAVFGTTP